MAATERATGMKQLQDRVAELERQLAALNERVAGVPMPGQPWWEAVGTAGRNDPGFHQAMEDLRREVVEERERDRAAVNAEMDRIEADEAAQKRKATAGKKARRAG